MTSTTKRARTRANRRMFGGIRRLPSGRYQVRYYGPDGERHTAPQTFGSKRDADSWLATSQADLVRGTWRDPDAGSQTLADYLPEWLALRTDLAPRTRQTYADSIERFLLTELTRPPHGARAQRSLDLGQYELRHITPALVREWYAAATYTQEARRAARRARGATNKRDRWPTAAVRAWGRQNGFQVADTGRLSPALTAAYRAARSPAPAPLLATPDPSAGPTPAIAQAYRSLRAALNTAVADGLLVVNPCQIRNAAEVKSVERVPATPAEVEALAAHMPEHLSAAVLVAAYTGLRAGELFALARRHVDLAAGSVRVERSLLELRDQPISFGPPKTDASRRTVHVPPHVLALLADHMAVHTGPGVDALVFTDRDGRSPLTTNRRTQLFARARRKVGRTDLRWHDLRHTGATLAAQAGATTRELQHRLGHSTFVAAMRYQHASAERDRDLAVRLSELVCPAPVPPPEQPAPDDDPANVVTLADRREATA